MRTPGQNSHREECRPRAPNFACQKKGKNKSKAGVASNAAMQTNERSSYTKRPSVFFLHLANPIETMRICGGPHTYTMSLPSSAGYTVYSVVVSSQASRTA